MATDSKKKSDSAYRNPWVHNAYRMIKAAIILLSIWCWELALICEFSNKTKFPKRAAMDKMEKKMEIMST